MKKKKVYNSKTIRISLGDYALLSDISLKANATFAEALHLLITETAKRQAIAVPKSQIPMPAFRVTSPVALWSRPQPVLATNGNKAGVLVIKAKGGSFND